MVVSVVSSSRVFPVLLVLLAGSLVSGQFSVTYRKVEYEFETEKRTSLFFEATFNQDVAVNYDPPSTCSKNRDPPSLVQCCGTTPCFNAVNATCIGAFPFQDSMVINSPQSIYPGMQVKKYQFQITSSRCSAGYFSIVSDNGAVYMNAYTYDGSVKMIITPTPTTTVALFCCSDLFKTTDSPRTFYLEVLALHHKPPVTISYTIYLDPYVMNSPSRLPLTRYYPFVSVSIGVTGIFNSVGCTYGSTDCLTNITATSDDPFYYFYSRTIQTKAITPVPKKFVWEVIMFTIDRNTDISSGRINPDLFADGTAVVTVWFNNLYNISNLLVSSPVKAIPSSSACNYDKTFFTSAVNEFNEAQSGLASFYTPAIMNIPAPDDFNTQSILAYWATARALAPLIHYNWLNCMDWMQGSLLRVNVSTSAVYETDECTYSRDVPAWYTDPCCNYALRASLCCAKRTVSVTDYTYIPLSTSQLTGSYCSAEGGNCAEEKLSKYVSADAIATACIADLSEDHPTTVLEIWDKCYSQLIGSTCEADSDCHQKFGSTTFCSPLEGSSVPWGTSRALFPSRACKWTCNTDSDCLYGTCKDMGLWRECRFSATTDPYINPNWAYQLADCLAGLVLQNSTALFKRSFLNVLSLNSAASKAQIAAKIVATSASSSPCSVQLFPSLDFPDSVACPTYSNEYSTCNSQLVEWESALGISSDFCSKTENFVATTSYCGYTPKEHPIVFPEVTQRGDCYLFTTYSYFGIVNPRVGCSFSSYQNFKWGQMSFLCNWAQSSPMTQNQCLLPQYCTTSSLIPIERSLGISEKDKPPKLKKGFACLPRCHGTAYSTSTSCPSPGQWNSDLNICELPAVSAESCMLYTTFSPFWWPGAFYFPPQYSASISACASFCETDLSTISPDDCANGFYCSTPGCTTCTGSDCLNSGICTALPGCYFPLNSNYSCDVASIQTVFSDYQAQNYNPLDNYIYWTPVGCRVVFPGGFTPINEFACTTKGGKYISYSQWTSFTKSTCEGYLNKKICKIPNVDFEAHYGSILSGNPSYVPRHNPPPDVSMVLSSCSTCGGTQTSAFRWIPGKLVSANESFVNLKIVSPRQLSSIASTIPSPPYTVIKKADFFSAFEVVDLLREIDSTKQRGDCYWSTVTLVLPIVSCLCRGRNDTSATNCNCSIVIDPTKASFTICSGFPTTLSRPGIGLTVIVTENFTLSDPSACVGITTKLNTNYLTAPIYTTPTGRSFNTQAGRDSTQYLKNSHNIIIGEVLDNGTYFDYSLSEPLNGVYFCLRLPSSPRFPVTLARLSIKSNTTIGGLEINSFPLSIIGNDSSNMQACLQLQSGYVYFPVAYSDNPNLIYLGTMSPRDIAAAIAGLVIYGIGIFICLFFLLMDIKGRRLSLMNWVKPASLCFIVAFSLRMGYFGWLMNDPTNDTITILFIELPSQILWSYASILLTRWITNDEEKKAKCGTCLCCLLALKMYTKVIIFLNGVLFIIYMIFMFGPIGTNKLPGSIIFEEQRTASFIWFAWFITFCFVSLFWFAFVFLSVFFGTCSGPEAEQKTKKGLFASLVASILIYLGQIILLIRTFLWTEPPPNMEVYYGWTMSGEIGTMILVDFIPFIPMWYASLMAPSPKVQKIFGILKVEL